MKKFSVFFAALCSVFVARAQDPLFLNTNQSLIYLNPSFAGTNGFIRDQASYRNQWPNLSGNFVTYLNSFDAYVKPLKGGIAVSLLSDDQSRGTLKTTVASIAYARHFSFRNGDLKIIPSLQAAYGQRNLDVSNLHYGNMVDARYGFVLTSTNPVLNSRVSYLDLSSGILVNYKNLYLGASVFHFNRPDVGLMGTVRIPVLYSLNASYNKSVNQNLLLNFSGRLIVQSKFVTTQGAVNVVYKKLLAGFGYRSEVSPFISAGFRAEKFTFMLSHDRSFSELSGLNAASWELMVSFSVRKDITKGNTTHLEQW